jgi:hypothetical protein
MRHAAAGGDRWVSLLSAPSEVIGGGHDALANAEVPRVMSGLAYNDEFATGPILRKPPWGDERGA